MKLYFPQNVSAKMHLLQTMKMIYTLNKINKVLSFPTYFYV